MRRRILVGLLIGGLIAPSILGAGTRDPESLFGKGWRATCTECDWKAFGSADKAPYNSGERCPTGKLRPNVCKKGKVIVEYPK